MKTLSTLAILAAFLSTPAVLLAQAPVSTGVILKLDRDASTMTLRTEQPNAAPLTFHGMNKAKIQSTGGTAKTLADLTEGTKVTVQYAQQGDRWYVSKVLVTEPGTPGAAPATGAAAVGAAAGTPATGATAPASKDPRTDGDRTTRPGQAAAGDITVRPADTNPATDGDRTTQPGSTTVPIRQSPNR